jgi:hypothetical protein
LGPYSTNTSDNTISTYNTNTDTIEIPNNSSNIKDIPVSGNGNNSLNIDWDNVLKKEARGIDNADLGEVQTVHDEYIITQKGIANKHKYHLPRNLATRFDGHKLWFKVTENEVDQYKNDSDSINYIYNHKIFLRILK